VKTHQTGKSVGIDAVPEGSCFAFRRREVTYVAIKITNGKMIVLNKVALSVQINMKTDLREIRSPSIPQRRRPADDCLAAQGE
jgi:hypothetical protein